MRPSLVLRVGGSVARAQLVRRGKVLWAGEAGFTTPEELDQAVSQLASGDGLPVRPTAIRVELEPPLIQVRRLSDIPPVRPAQLRALVATQSGRFFRRNGKPLVTDACWESRSARRSGTALAAAAEQSWLEAVIRGAHAAGVVVRSISPAVTGKPVRLGLMPEAERQRRRAEAVLSVRRLATVALLTWGTAGGVYLARLHRELAGLEAEIARLKPAVQAVGDARRRLRDAARTVETLDRAAGEQGAVLARLSALAVNLPDSAFVSTLEVNAGGRGTMSVVARRSSEVMAAIDRAGVLVSPRLEGSVVQEAVAGSDWERFTISFGPASGR